MDSWSYSPGSKLYCNNILVQVCLEKFINLRYMKGRLTLDKVNAAINDMAAYADANFQLITAPRKKVLHLS